MKLSPCDNVTEYEATLFVSNDTFKEDFWNMSMETTQEFIYKYKENFVSHLSVYLFVDPCCFCWDVFNSFVHFVLCRNKVWCLWILICSCLNVYCNSELMFDIGINAMAALSFKFVLQASMRSVTCIYLYFKFRYFLLVLSLISSFLA